jgi:hypothetical protein
MWLGLANDGLVLTNFQGDLPVAAKLLETVTDTNLRTTGKTLRDDAPLVPDSGVTIQKGGILL